MPVFASDPDSPLNRERNEILFAEIQWCRVKHPPSFLTSAREEGEVWSLLFLSSGGFPKPSATVGKISIPYPNNGQEFALVIMLSFLLIEGETGIIEANPWQ